MFFPNASLKLHPADGLRDLRHAGTGILSETMLKSARFSELCSCTIFMLHMRNAMLT